MFEFRWNSENRDWILLETNARFWGSSPLPLSLGVDFPRFLYDLLVHHVQHPPVQYAAGVRSRNLLLDGFNLFAGVRGLRPSEIGAWFSGVGDFLTQPVRWLTGRERSDTFVRDDPRPAIRECALLLRTFGQKRARNRSPELNRRRSERIA